MKSLWSFMKKLLTRYKKDYIKHLQEIAGYSLQTVKTYETVLEEALSLADIEEERAQMNIMGYRLKIASQAKKTIAKKLSAIRSFVKFVNERGTVLKLKGDDSIKVPKTLPKPVAHKYIMEVIETADLEVKLLITMLYTLGLRISELSHIELKNMTSQWVRVRGKGDKEREIPLLDDVNTLLQHYQVTHNPKVFLFEKDGQKLSENVLRYKINKAFKKHGLKVTPHQLRHAYATELINAGARINDVSELLGHKSLATTQIYTKLATNTKLNNYLNAHPLCKDLDEA